MAMLGAVDCYQTRSILGLIDSRILRYRLDHSLVVHLGDVTGDVLGVGYIIGSHISFVDCAVLGDVVIFGVVDVVGYVFGDELCFNFRVMDLFVFSLITYFWNVFGFIDCIDHWYL